MPEYPMSDAQLGQVPGNWGIAILHILFDILHVSIPPKVI
jgi:hypothetical protein